MGKRRLERNTRPQRAVRRRHKIAKYPDSPSPPVPPRRRSRASSQHTSNYTVSDLDHSEPSLRENPPAFADESDKDIFSDSSNDAQPPIRTIKLVLRVRKRQHLELDTSQPELPHETENEVGNPTPRVDLDARNSTTRVNRRTQHDGHSSRIPADMTDDSSRDHPLPSAKVEANAGRNAVDQFDAAKNAREMSSVRAHVDENRTQRRRRTVREVRFSSPGVKHTSAQIVGNSKATLDTDTGDERLDQTKRASGKHVRRSKRHRKQRHMHGSGHSMSGDENESLPNSVDKIHTATGAQRFGDPGESVDTSRENVDTSIGDNRGYQNSPLGRDTGDEAASNSSDPAEMYIKKSRRQRKPRRLQNNPVEMIPALEDVVADQEKIDDTGDRIRSPVTLNDEEPEEEVTRNSNKPVGNGVKGSSAASVKVQVRRSKRPRRRRHMRNFLEFCSSGEEGMPSTDMHSSSDVEAEDEGAADGSERMAKNSADAKRSYVDSLDVEKSQDMIAVGDEAPKTSTGPAEPNQLSMQHRIAEEVQNNTAETDDGDESKMANVKQREESNTFSHRAVSANDEEPEEEDKVAVDGSISREDDCENAPLYSEKNDRIPTSSHGIEPLLRRSTRHRKPRKHRGKTSRRSASHTNVMLMQKKLDDETGQEAIAKTDKSMPERENDLSNSAGNSHNNQTSRDPDIFDGGANEVESRIAAYTRRSKQYRKRQDVPKYFGGTMSIGDEDNMSNIMNIEETEIRADLDASINNGESAEVGRTVKSSSTGEDDGDAKASLDCEKNDEIANKMADGVVREVRKSKPYRGEQQRQSDSAKRITSEAKDASIRKHIDGNDSDDGANQDADIISNESVEICKEKPINSADDNPISSRYLSDGDYGGRESRNEKLHALHVQESLRHRKPEAVENGQTEVNADDEDRVGSERVFDETDTVTDRRASLDKEKSSDEDKAEDDAFDKDGRKNCDSKSDGQRKPRQLHRNTAELSLVEDENATHPKSVEESNSRTEREPSRPPKDDKPVKQRKKTADSSNIEDTKRPSASPDFDRNNDSVVENVRSIKLQVRRSKRPRRRRQMHNFVEFCSSGEDDMASPDIHRSADIEAEDGSPVNGGEITENLPDENDANGCTSGASTSRDADSSGYTGKEVENCTMTPNRISTQHRIAEEVQNGPAQMDGDNDARAADATNLDGSRVIINPEASLNGEEPVEHGNGAVNGFMDKADTEVNAPLDSEKNGETANRNSGGNEPPVRRSTRHRKPRQFHRDLEGKSASKANNTFIRKKFSDNGNGDGTGQGAVVNIDESVEDHNENRNGSINETGQYLDTALEPSSIDCDDINDNRSRMIDPEASGSSSPHKSSAMELHTEPFESGEVHTTSLEDCEKTATGTNSDAFVIANESVQATQECRKDIVARDCEHRNNSGQTHSDISGAKRKSVEVAHGTIYSEIGDIARKAFGDDSRTLRSPKRFRSNEQLDEDEVRNLTSKAKQSEPPKVLDDIDNMADLEAFLDQESNGEDSDIPNGVDREGPSLHEARFSFSDVQPMSPKRSAAPVSSPDRTGDEALKKDGDGVEIHSRRSEGSQEQPSQPDSAEICRPVQDSSNAKNLDEASHDMARHESNPTHSVGKATVSKRGRPRNRPTSVCDDLFSILPRVKLWSGKERKALWRRVEIPVLAELMGTNPDLSLYVGQDNPTALDKILSILSTGDEKAEWYREMEKPALERAVMILDPWLWKMLPPSMCPIVDGLKEYCLRIMEARPGFARLRIFAGKATAMQGFSFEMREFVRKPGSIEVIPPCEQCLTVPLWITDAEMRILNAKVGRPLISTAVSNGRSAPQIKIRKGPASHRSDASKIVAELEVCENVESSHKANIMDDVFGRTGVDGGSDDKGSTAPLSNGDSQDTEEVWPNEEVLNRLLQNSNAVESRSWRLEDECLSESSLFRMIPVNENEVAAEPEVLPTTPEIVLDEADVHSNDTEANSKRPEVTTAEFERLTSEEVQSVESELQLRCHEALPSKTNVLLDSPEVLPADNRVQVEEARVFSTENAVQSEGLHQEVGDSEVFVDETRDRVEISELPLLEESKALSEMLMSRPSKRKCGPQKDGISRDGLQPEPETPESRPKGSGVAPLSTNSSSEKLGVHQERQEVSLRAAVEPISIVQPTRLILRLRLQRPVVPSAEIGAQIETRESDSEKRGTALRNTVTPVELKCLRQEDEAPSIGHEYGLKLEISQNHRPEHLTESNASDELGVPADESQLQSEKLDYQPETQFVHPESTSVRSDILLEQSELQPKKPNRPVEEPELEPDKQNDQSGIAFSPSEDIDPNSTRADISMEKPTLQPSKLNSPRETRFVSSENPESGMNPDIAMEEPEFQPGNQTNQGEPQFVSPASESRFARSDVGVEELELQSEQHHSLPEKQMVSSGDPGATSDRLETAMEENTDGHAETRRDSTCLPEYAPVRTAMSIEGSVTPAKRDNLPEARCCSSEAEPTSDRPDNPLRVPKSQLEKPGDDVRTLETSAKGQKVCSVAPDIPMAESEYHGPKPLQEAPETLPKPDVVSLRLDPAVKEPEVQLEKAGAPHDALGSTPRPKLLLEEEARNHTRPNILTGRTEAASKECEPVGESNKSLPTGQEIQHCRMAVMTVDHAAESERLKIISAENDVQLEKPEGMNSQLGAPSKQPKVTQLREQEEHFQEPISGRPGDEPGTISLRTIKLVLRIAAPKKQEASRGNGAENEKNCSVGVDLHHSNCSLPKGKPPNRRQLLRLRISPPKHERDKNLLDGNYYSKRHDVYTWDLKDLRRSSYLIPLREAVQISTNSGRFTIYDGQDFEHMNNHSFAGFGVPQGDEPKWCDRLMAGKTISPKIRVWDSTEGLIRCFRFSPTVRYLVSWLGHRPKFSVFPASFVLGSPPSPSEYFGELGTIFESLSPRTRFSWIVHRKVISRIRYLRDRNVPEQNQGEDGGKQTYKVWNMFIRQPEELVYSSRKERVKYLFANPWLEVYCGQDELECLELSHGFKLIPILLCCPAGKACFWDKVSQRRILQPQRDPRFQDKTVLECLDHVPNIELYLGQDIDDNTSIQRFIEWRQSAGFFPYRYMFAHCGPLAQVFAHGWTALHIDVKSQKTSSAVFWNSRSGGINMQPDSTAFKTIEMFLQQHGDVWEPYIGQDLPSSIKNSLKDWYDLLKYVPGYSPTRQKAMLVKTGFIPSSFAALRQGHDGNYSVPEKPKDVGERDPDVVQRPMEGLDPKSGKHAIDGTDDNLGGTTTTLVKSLPPRATANVDTESNLPVSQDTTNYSEEDLDGSICDSSLHSSEDSTIGEKGVVDSSESSLLRKDCEAVDFSEADLFAQALENAKKKMELVRTAGPRIVKGELLNDQRQALREALLAEVGSVRELEEFLSGVRLNEFISAAEKLCSTLELLDVYSCFTSSREIRYGPSDLFSMREELVCGKIFSVSEVIEKFRVVCAELIMFYGDGFARNEAIQISRQGEVEIRRFERDNREVLKAEQRFYRIAVVCEKGSKCGFRRSITSEALTLSSPFKKAGQYKPSMRVSGCQPQISFENYRDENGYSVMGKRQSARVFGLSIDWRACEYAIGNMRPCHVCKRELYQSNGDSLICFNRVYGFCQEWVCRQCLENIFGMTQAEFVRCRADEYWTCVHCRDMCPNPEKCEQHCPKGIELSSSNQEEWVVFKWSHSSRRAREVRVSFAIRGLNGEFADFCSDSIVLKQVNNSPVWSAKLKLKIGAYRCMIEEDGQCVASTTVQVVPDSSRGKTNSETEMEAGHIKWVASKYHRNGTVHSLSADNSVQLMQECSRTEGYDWRKSKRHAIVHWSPICKEPRASFTGRSADEALELSCSPRCLPRYFRRGEPPKLQKNMSLKEFGIASDTAKFDDMKKCLWGIMTGKSSIHGIGLFTLTGYQKGDFVIEYAGDLIRTPLGDLREAQYEASGLGTYLFKINEHHIVDATINSNRARFTNHSCDPNMKAAIIHIRGRDLVVLQATREIAPYSELTFNYQLPIEDKKLQCLCNSWNCIGVMN